MAHSETPTDDAQPTTDADEIHFGDELQAALERDNDPESHAERDATTFHPSQLAGDCPRKTYTGKFGLQDNSDALGVFKTGTMIHEFIEENVGPALAERGYNVQFETPVETTVEGITLTGHADAYAPDSGTLWDVKSRASWYRFDGPSQRHLDQLYLYMAATGAEKAQIVYVKKTDLEVRRWPADDDEEARDFFRFDAERFNELIDRAKEIAAHYEADGIATTPEEIPYEKCGCFICNKESLRFPHTHE